jgi:dehydrogenase/reductase SDR family member 1
LLDLRNSESPEFVGRAIAALAADPEVMRHSGEVRVVANLAIGYGFSDIDGKIPSPLRSQTSELRGGDNRPERSMTRQ